MSRITWVVAHFKEDLTWLQPVADRAIIYHKGGDTGSIPACFKNVVLLPNIGRESHTYLAHIAHNYHNLSEFVLFVQGSVSDHVGNEWDVHSMEQHIMNSQRPLTTFHAPVGRLEGNNWNGLDHCGIVASALRDGHMLYAGIPPRQWWEQYLESPAPETGVKFFIFGIFGVTRQAIHKHTISYYGKLLNEFERNPHISPEIGHFMERSWLTIFDSEEAYST